MNMPEDRRLAAIMFTDIVGYTKLMGEDEDKAFEILKINREIHTLQLSKYDGTFIKEMGDGILASFPSPLKAVQCAIAIQEESKSENIALRIGIHEADVVFKGGDILGDGVNVASRLEELAEEGCINLSGTVYKDIRNKAGIKVEFLEEQVLKNVEEPVKVYKVCCEKGEDNKIKKAPHVQSSKPSIAVLPFVNMSPDPEQEYFCDGMSEEIINALSHVEGLKVIARTSSFYFKGEKVDIADIGKKLSVKWVLEGSVRKAGNRIRITAQLIKVSDGTHLWSERYDRDLEDVFAIQDEISIAIVENLKVKLLETEKEAIEKRYTEDLEAYNLCLKGRFYALMFTQEGYKKAVEFYEQSLQKDPNFSLAYVYLAYIPIFGSFFGNLPPKEAYPKAKEYLKKALELDNSLASAHMARSVIHIHYDWNWDAAEKELKLAMQLDPNSAYIHISYSNYLIFNGRYDEAILEAKKAQELDPLSDYINTELGLTYVWAGQHDRAIEEQLVTIAMNPGYHLAHFHLGHAYIGKSMLIKAIEAYETAASLSGGAPIIVAWLASAYYLIGEKAQAEKLINNLKQRSKKEYVPATCFIGYHLLQGDFDQAYMWLEKAIDEHDSFLPWMLVYPDEKYRIPDEPRFNELLKKVGLKRRST